MCGLHWRYDSAHLPLSLQILQENRSTDGTAPAVRVSALPSIFCDLQSLL